MKQKLFILSIFIGFVSCKNEPRPSDEKVTITPIEALFEVVFNWERTIANDIDSLIKVINSSNRYVNAYNLKNPIEPGNILFTSEKNSLLIPFKQKATELMGEPISYDTYEVWRGEINGKKILEFSLSPHPREGWIFMIRKKR